MIYFPCKYGVFSYIAIFLQQFRPVAKGLPLQGSVNTIFSINGKKQTQDKTCVCSAYRKSLFAPLSKFSELYKSSEN